MIRLLFIPFLALVLFGCGSSSDEVDSLGYQLSEADSTKYMDEILEGFVEEGKENRREEVYFLRKYKPMHYTYRGAFLVKVNSGQELLINFGCDSLSIAEGVFDYYTFNRNLTSKEAIAAAKDRNSPHFKYPFFNKFGMEEIERKIEECTQEFHELEQTEGVDSALLDYYESTSDKWEARKWLMEFLDIDELPEIRVGARVNIEYKRPSTKLEEVQNDVAFGYYLVRNHFSIFYFEETYLSLYARSKRLNRKSDLKKLEALEMLQPISMFLIDESKPNPLWEEIPEPPKDLK